MSARQFYILCLLLSAVIDAIMSIGSVKVSGANKAHSHAMDALESYMDDDGRDKEGNLPTWYS